VSIRTSAFADELTKLGGVAMNTLKGVAGAISRNKMRTLGAAFIAVPTGMAMYSGYRGGAEGGRQRQLAAGPDDSGRIRASEAAYTNYHELFPHKASPRAVRALSKNYKPEMFTASKNR
jgi:hypothetical protein